MKHTILPTVQWAQRKDRVFLTIEIRDIKDEKLDLKPDSIKFSATVEGHEYAFEINFFAPINVEESKWSVLGLHGQIILVKADTEAKYWPRLHKETFKPQYIQVDWNKYVDEDDEEEEGQKGLGGGDWNQDQFQNFDQGGQDDEGDEDDEGQGGNLDDLDKEEEIANKQGEEQIPENK